MEKWKSINQYSNYEISNLGRVRSLPREVKTGIAKYTSKERILKPQMWKNGYQFVCLCKNGVVKQFSIHRLVAIHFVDGFSDGLEVNHINEIKTDNSSENLEWVTKAQNLNHGNRKINSRNIKDNSGKNNPMFGIKGVNNVHSKKITQSNSKKEKLKTFDSLAEAADAFKISRSGISRAARRGIKCGGFYWSY